MKVINWIRENKLLFLCLIAGTVLRFYKIDHQSLWIDEIFSLIQSDPEKSYGGIYRFLKQYDPHPPLYYFSLHFFFQVFGYSPLIARVFSALIGVGCLLAIYRLGKELSGKRVGLIAVVLLTVNYFHIYYSQEARMYSMLFLTTTLSFYYLVKFIKMPTLRSALIYGAVSALMIYTQFFALFALFAQYLILLFFVVKPFKATRVAFFRYALAAGVLTFILYIPALFIFLETFKRTSIWIPMPGLDVYTQMFKEFFGHSEIVLFFVVSAIILYFIKLYQDEPKEAVAIDPIEEKQAFGFFILITWILVTLLIPLISSYVNLPMIISRYFINILPALIIMVATGISYIRNKTVEWLVVAFFVVFSVTDLVVVKDYYNKVTKSQFRELTQEIKSRNPRNSKVMTYWSWLLPYYFRDTPQISVENGNLQEYIAQLKSGAAKPVAFWYADGHSRPFALSPEEQEYLDKTFVLKEKLDYYDAWAHYYVPANETSLSQDNGSLLNKFNHAHFDAQGNMAIYENANLRTEFFTVEPGDYKLVIEGNSLPEKPIDKQNAHIVVRMNGTEIANFNLSEDPARARQEFGFKIDKKTKVRFQLIYDNDVFSNGQDRNVIIHSIKIEKKSTES